MTLVKSAQAFLGLDHYDCLLCHNGRGHLDALSLWGSQTTRSQAEPDGANIFRAGDAPAIYFPGGYLERRPAGEFLLSKLDSRG